MHDFVPNSPNFNVPRGSPERERTLEEAKWYEAQQIGILAEVLHNTLWGDASGPDGANDALLCVEALCSSLAKRDPEFGHLIVGTLAAHSRRHIEVQDMAVRLREELEAGSDAPGSSQASEPTGCPPSAS